MQTPGGLLQDYASHYSKEFYSLKNSSWPVSRS